MDQRIMPTPPTTIIDTMLVDRRPITPISCLATRLPLRFHGQYECMVDSNFVLTPGGAPEIDVLSWDANAESIDEALQFAVVHDWTGETRDKFVRLTRKLLLGEAGKLDDWRIWQVDLELDNTLGIYLVRRGDDCGTIVAVRLPLPRQMSLSFRIWDDAMTRTNHKLYVSTCWTRLNGRELKVAEWIPGQKITQVCWWLDTNEVISDGTEKPDTTTIDHLRQS